MSRIKEQVLREFGDHGADTLERYFAQVEYTAFWCIRMLRDAEGIEAVIPEGVEDVVVLQRGVYRLRQVKTRGESQGPWTTADVLPILCQQYHRRHAFPPECRYHFVSNQIADNKTALRTGSYGPLYRLKELLDIEHDGQQLNAHEQTELNKLEAVLVPKIQETLLSQCGDDVDFATAVALLHSTYIETDCITVRNPNNLAELEDGLTELSPGTPPSTTAQLREMYDRLLLLVIRKIITGASLEARQVMCEDVLNCRTPVCAPIAGYPNLNSVPGRTLLDKKAWLGGFDATELSVFHKQSKLAERTIRQFRSLGLVDTLNRLATAILDLQRSCRHKVCREQGINRKPGPRILAMLRPELASLAKKYFPESTEVDEQFCQGILWQETDLCSVWWHGLDGSAQGMVL